MKKKILFMIINMNIGGTEKALLNMVEEIDNNEYDVTIMMLEKYGGFLKDIPKWVNIKYFENYNDIKEGDIIETFIIKEIQRSLD